MLLQVCIAHTGERLEADAGSFASLDALRAWVSQTVGISQSNQILMTARGRQVKLQTLLTEKEIFVYDRLLISPSSKTSIEVHVDEVAIPPPFKPREAPDTLSSQTDLGAWRKLFMGRRTWALELADQCSVIFDAARKHLDEIKVIERAVTVAISNLTTHVSTLEQKTADAQTWIQEITAEQEPAIVGWQDTVARLRRLPAKESVLQSRFFRNKLVQDRRTQNRLSLGSSEDPSVGHLVEVEPVERAASTAREILRHLGDRATTLDGTVAHVVASSHELVEKVKRWTDESDPDSIEDPERTMEDIEVIAKKIVSDYEHILSLPDTSKSLSQASRKALVHTQDYIPSLNENAYSLGRFHRQVVGQRNASATIAVQHLQTISAVESVLANASHQLSTLAVSSQGLAAFALLGSLDRLPYIYGSVLVESIRRREWNEKVKADSATLAEELAAFTDEEEARRKRWQRSVSDIIAAGSTEERPVSVEINLQGNEQSWPHVERYDLDDYLSGLKQWGGTANVVKELSELVNELDRPTRQQSKRARAFKNRSVHEAALGQSSLLLRGDDGLVQSLRDEKLKLEEKLRGSESRIRKLEDIVHRQSDISRNPSGNMFQTANALRSDLPSTTSPNPQSFTASTRPHDALSRRSSASSRRFSANYGTEEKALVQRVVSLEAELIAEREITAGLRRELSAKQDAANVFQERIEEADSTKKDLMENLEAQQREFSDERKLLEENLGKVKIRLEELEDELDRVMGSRENEKAESDGKARALEVQVDAIRQKTAEHLRQLQHELDVERARTRQHQQVAAEAEVAIRRAATERQALEDAIHVLERRLQENIDLQSEQQKGLENAHNLLSPNEKAPDDSSRLIEAVQWLIERSSHHLREVENALELTRADNEALRSRIDRAQSDYTVLKDKLGAEEMESFVLRETLAGERGRLSSLGDELKEERTQLTKLRAKFADGETGSEALRARVAEEERHVTELRSKLAAAEGQMKVLEEELHSRRDEIRRISMASRHDAERSQVRALRTKHLSERLFSMTDRLSHLLETVGFILTSQDGSVVIQRISRAMSASLTDTGAQSPNEARTLATSMQLRASDNSSSDLQLTHWMDALDPGVESERYGAYLDVIQKFDADVFSEAIAKRVKDTEHVARKWQKEARLYREKTHRLQMEAHQKIAYRSFREGDLALFLPTRNQATRPWAAFNVGAPHFFLREQDSHKLQSRDWLLARITKVEERVVDLSKTINGGHSTTGADGRSIGGSSDGGGGFGEDENPFELSDGLRWYLLDAAEEKPGAPSTPGLGKSTVASAHVDAKGSVRMKKSGFGSSGATKTLSKSLDSRRSSSNSKKEGGGTVAAATPTTATAATAIGNATGIAAADGSRGSTSGGLVSPDQDGQPQGLRVHEREEIGNRNNDAGGGPEGPWLRSNDDDGDDDDHHHHHRHNPQEVRSDLLWGP